MTCSFAETRVAPGERVGVDAGVRVWVGLGVTVAVATFGAIVFIGVFVEDGSVGKFLIRSVAVEAISANVATAAIITVRLASGLFSDHLDERGLEATIDPRFVSRTRPGYGDSPVVVDRPASVDLQESNPHTARTTICAVAGNYPALTE